MQTDNKLTLNKQKRKAVRNKIQKYIFSDTKQNIVPVCGGSNVTY